MESSKLSPKIDTGVDLETVQAFQTQWKQLGNQLSKDPQSLQLFQCASEALGNLLNQHNSANVSDNPPEVTVKPLERMVLIPASKRITRVELMKMSQGNDEPIRTFAARVQNKAKICGFQKQSKSSCGLTIDYTQEVVKDVILAGIADNKIRMDVLDIEGIKEKSIDDIVELIEQKENGRNIYSSSDASTMSPINHSQSQVGNSSNLVPTTSNNDLIHSCDEDVTNVAVEQTSHATTSKLVCDGESSSLNNSDEEMETNETGHSLEGDEQKKINMEKQQLQVQQIQQLVQYLTSPSNTQLYNNYMLSHPNIQYMLNQLGVFAQQQQSNLLGANNQQQPNLLGANDQQLILVGANDQQLSLFGANDQQLSLVGATDQQQSSQGSSKMDARPHKCPHCPKRYKYPHDLARHKNIHDKNKQIKCGVCKVKVFATKRELDKHMLSHTKEKKHQCPTCNHWFGRISTLRTHQYTHLKEKTFKCPKCPVAKYFQSPHHLANHMIYHKKEKQHECSICHKEFHRSSDLKVHQRVHTKLKEFQCDICKKRFTTAGTLQNHIRLHTGEKPYECEVCHKSFSDASNCKSHMKNCATRMENDNSSVPSIQNDSLTSDP